MGEPQLPRLERWRIAPDFLKPQARRDGEIVIVGEIHNDLGPQKRPNGTFFEMLIAAEPIAAEGVIVKGAVCKLNYLLGAPASSEFLALELYKAQVEVDKLTQQLLEKPSATRRRPRGRPPTNCT